jgi:transposase
MFRCVRCGFERNADLVGSWNIRDRYRGLWSPVSRVPGRVNGPNVNTPHGYSQAPHFSAG